MTHKVTFEIEVDSENPNPEQAALEAAKEVQRWLHDARKNWQFYVQDTHTEKVYSIDLEEEDEDAVLPVDKYEPLIKTK